MSEAVIRCSGGCRKTPRWQLDDMGQPSADSRRLVCDDCLTVVLGILWFERRRPTLVEPAAWLRVKKEAACGASAVQASPPGSNASAS